MTLPQFLIPLWNLISAFHFCLILLLRHVVIFQHHRVDWYIVLIHWCLYWYCDTKPPNDSGWLSIYDTGHKRGSSLACIKSSVSTKFWRQQKSFGGKSLNNNCYAFLQAWDKSIKLKRFVIKFFWKLGSSHKEECSVNY